MGIKFNSNTLKDIAVYFPDRSESQMRSLNEYKQLSPNKSSLWRRNGCVRFDLFACTPIAYHLNIGTKIIQLQTY